MFEYEGQLFVLFYKKDKHQLVNENFITFLISVYYFHHWMTTYKL